MIATRHWVLAGGLAISVHALAFYAVFNSPPQGSQAPGSQGIEFDLGMMGDLGVAAQTTMAQEEVKEVEEIIEEIIEEPIEEVVEDTVEPEPIIEPEPVVEPEPMTEPEPIIEPEPIVEPEPVEVKQASPIEVEKPKAIPKKEPKVESKPIPKKELKKEPKKEPKVEPKPVPKKVAPPSAANQKATTGSANSASTGGNPGAKADYFTQLSAVLGSNKRYPRASRRRSEEGVVTLSFVAHADGSVSGVSITESSGHRRLDDAVLDMVKRSVPLPRFTKGMVESELRITLPVSFKLSDLR